MLKNTSAKAETRTNLTSPHKGRVKPLKEIEEIVLAPTRGQRKFSRPRDNLRSLQEHPVQGCEWTRSVQSALSARRQGSSQRRRRLTTPLRVAQGSPIGGTAAPRKWCETWNAKSALEAYTPIRAFSTVPGRRTTKGKHTRRWSETEATGMRSSLRGVVRRRRRLTPRGGISCRRGVQPTRNERGWRRSRNP